MLKFLRYAPIVFCATAHGASSVFETFRDHAKINELAMAHAAASDAPPLFEAGPLVASATLRFEDDAQQKKFVQILDFRELISNELDLIQFPFAREPSLKYFGLEFSEPYLIKTPRALSTGTSFRVLGVDRSGRVYWFAREMFEIVSIDSLIRPLRDFDVVGPIRGPVWLRRLFGR